MSAKRYDKEYADNGYFVIESAIAAADLESIKSAAQTIIDDFDVDQHRSVFSTLHRDTERDQYFIDSAEAVHCFLEEDALERAYAAPSAPIIHANRTIR